MNWKHEAIDRLKTYELKLRAIQSIPEQIQELEMEMTAIRSTTSDGEAVRGGGNRQEDALLSNIAKRDELHRALERVQKSVSITDAALELLTGEEREVLDRFYIHHHPRCVQVLCESLGAEQASVYRKKKEALWKFTLAIYGCEES